MLRRIERVLLELSVLAILALGGMITVSVLLRALFNSGLPDTVVMVRELMVAAILLPLAAATAARSHIVVEFVASRLPPRLQNWLVVFGTLFGLFALAPLLYAGWREASLALSTGSFFFGELNLPRWPGRVIFLVGISFCWLRLAVMAIEDVRTILRGGHPPGVVERKAEAGRA